jgi:DNA-binding response OmpR family regulator
MKILLADSDGDLVDLMSYALRRRGCAVLTAARGDQAMQRVLTEQPDLVVLEAALPDGDGVEVCRRIRQSSWIPIVFLGGGSQETDLMRSYQAGADDYIVKPFSIPHLILRLENVMRRAGVGQAPGAGRESARLQIGDLVIDAPAFHAEKNGVRLPLTRLEFRILSYLGQHLGTLVNAGTLADYARGTATGGDVDLLKTHISHIRQKLNDAGGIVLQIRAVPRTGYVLSVDQADATPPVITSQRSA